MKSFQVIHPDFEKLISRYRQDTRFVGKEIERQKCIDYLLGLGSWIQKITMPTDISAVLLAGSFSCINPEIPDLAPVVRGPWFNGVRDGGSDMDVLFIYSSNISGLLRLKWLNFNVPEREICHPDDFVVNSIDFLKRQLKQDCSDDLNNRVDVHVSVLTKTLGKFALKKYVRHMIQTGTLVWGNLPVSDYGKYRENPPAFRRPKYDPIIDRMTGTF